MGDGGSDDSYAVRQQELDREKRVSEGTAQIRKQFSDVFNDNYYLDFKKDGKNWYIPKLDKQYNESLKQLNYALMRNGLAKSSAQAQEKSRLGAEYITNADNVGETIQNQVNARKTDVANQETIAASQLQSTGDMQNAAAQAAGLIRSSTEFPGWSPLGQVFTDATSFLANQADAERSGNARYNIGVSRWGDNTRRYLSNIGK